MSLYFRSICFLRKMNGHQSLSILKSNVSHSARLISWGNCKANPIRQLPSLLRRRHFLILQNFAVCKSTVRTRKVKINRSEVRRILQLAKDEKWRLTGAVVLLLISSVVTMSVPFCIGKVVDIIYASEKGSKKGQLNYLTGIFIAVFIIGGIAVFGRVYLIQTSGQRIVQKLRTNIFSSIINQELAFFDKHKTGELLNRLSADTTIVGQSVTQNVSDGLRALAGALASISMMVYMSPYLSLVSLCTVPPVAAIGIIYGKYVSDITKKVQDALADVNQVAEERISNIRLVKAFAQEEKEKKYYFEKIKKVLGLQTKEALAKAAFFGAAGLSGNLVILTVLYSGGSMMADSQITVGELSAFLMYAAYLGVSLNGLSSFYSELMRGLAASTELWRIVDRIPVVQSKDGFIPSSSCLGAIQFQSITFSYPNRSNVNVFENLNLSIPAGSVTAIVGGSGSGKSTLGALLLRYYDPHKGSVTVDGRDIRDLNLDWLRNNIGTVSQEPVLFSCSVRDNILYGIKNSDSVSEELIIQAAKEANAYDFINSFPEKFDTLVGERGMMLSGGQRQRLAICRAIIKNPRILLLDEATSALDAESEHLVQEALERLLTNRTVITIAHRLSTIKNADQIAVLYNKQFTELGSYESLMKIENGMFRKLVEHQMISSDSKPQ